MDKLSRALIERHLNELKEELEIDQLERYELRVRRRQLMDGEAWVIWIQNGRGVRQWCSDPVIDAMTLAVAMALVRVMLEVMAKPADEVEVVRCIAPSRGCQL